MQTVSQREKRMKGQKKEKERKFDGKTEAGSRIEERGKERKEGRKQEERNTKENRRRRKEKVKNYRENVGGKTRDCNECAVPPSVT